MDTQGPHPADAALASYSARLITLFVQPPRIHNVPISAPSGLTNGRLDSKVFPPSQALRVPQ